jgi:hypothetical protein
LSAALVGGGCRQTPPPPPTSASADVDPLVQAREAMERRDHDAAIPLLREAVARRPADVEAHYRLGVSASHLDQVDEASRAFAWVVAHGDGATPEVRIAREWLASRTPSPTPTTAVGAPLAAAESAPDPARATLTGRAVDETGPQQRLQLFLKGVRGTVVQDEYHVIRTDQNGTFRFADVAPGEYMLTNTVARRPTWRLRVPLARGERLVLDLTPSNQTTVRDDFPE